MKTKLNTTNPDREALILVEVPHQLRATAAIFSNEDHLLRCLEKSVERSGHSYEFYTREELLDTFGPDESDWGRPDIMKTALALFDAGAQRIISLCDECDWQVFREGDPAAPTPFDYYFRASTRDNHGAYVLNYADFARLYSTGNLSRYPHQSVAQQIEIESAAERIGWLIPDIRFHVLDEDGDYIGRGTTEQEAIEDAALNSFHTADELQKHIESGHHRLQPAESEPTVLENSP